jgi:hypothetical protein
VKAWLDDDKQGPNESHFHAQSFEVFPFFFCQQKIPMSPEIKNDYSINALIISDTITLPLVPLHVINKFTCNLINIALPATLPPRFPSKFGSLVLMRELSMASRISILPLS